MMTKAGAATQESLYDLAPLMFGEPTATAGLDTLQDVVWLREQADRYVSEHVQVLRDQGMTWAQIGTALGITAQGAQQRYSR